MSIPPLSSSLDGLARAIDGEVIVPGSSSRYDRLSPPFNARFDAEVPQAIVRCASAGDVAEAISFLRRHRLPLAIRSGGHCFAGHSSTRGVVIDVSPMNAVSLSAGEATVGAGARLGEVYLGLLDHGLTIPGGSCPSVGIAGLTLGGGLGMLGRAHGVTSDHLVRSRIVLADGRILECDEDHDEELFWALRGAGAGNFGVVTEFAFRPISTPATTVFHLAWPFAHAATVAQAWLGWAGSAPGEIAASLVLTTGEDAEEPPAAEVFGTVLGTRPEAAALLEGLTARIKADPGSGLVQQMPYSESLSYWAERAGERLEDPRARPAARRYRVIKSEFFARALPPEAVGALIGHLAESRRAGQSRELDFSPWGAAYNRRRPDATAFVHRDWLYGLKHTATVGVSAPAAERNAAHRWTAGSWKLARRWGTGHVFPNFADPDLEDPGHAYYGPNYDRLLTVKMRYDPGNLFRFQQSLNRRV